MFLWGNHLVKWQKSYWNTCYSRSWNTSWHEMFSNLTKDHEEEKKNLKKRIEELSNAINLNKDTEKQVQHFIELIGK